MVVILRGGGRMKLQRPGVEDSWVLVIGCGLALISGIFWREFLPAMWRGILYVLEFIRWGLAELDKQDFFMGTVVIYSLLLLGVVWIWGYSVGQKSATRE